jgi:hypothetical protein
VFLGKFLFTYKSANLPCAPLEKPYHNSVAEKLPVTEQEDLMKSRLLKITLWSAVMMTVLSCAMVDRAFNPDQAAQPPEDAITAATDESQPAESAPTEEGPKRLELAPTPTPLVVSADDPRAVLDLQHPDHVDYFDNPDAWFDYDNPDRAAYKVEGGMLIGKDYLPEEKSTWWTYTDSSSGNLYAEVSATNGDCIGRDSMGMAVRVDNATAAGGYSLEVSCDGEYRFRRHSKNGSPTDYIDWTASDAINTGPGATNRLGIWGYQGRFRLFINGQEVGEFWDRDYLFTFGTFALFTRASQTYELTGTFDDFAYWNIKFIP